MKKRLGKNAGDLFAITGFNRFCIVAVLLLITAIWVFPVYSLLNNALKVNGFGNFTYIIQNRINGVSFYAYFINSVFNAICASAILVLVCSLAGFAFAKIRFTGSKIMYNLIIMSFAISGPVILIPLFYVFRMTGLYNTSWAVIFSEALISIPFGVLMMKSIFSNLPNELMESANIDGASLAANFFRIHLPLAKPAIINLLILQVMWSFQDFLFPVMFLTREERYTATVAVKAFKGAYGMAGQSLGRYNAALVLISLPTILVFMFAQRFIIRGITAGAIKE
jgi:ABC-type glycerol-3-phosphate transport system permease component